MLTIHNGALIAMNNIGIICAGEFPVEKNSAHGSNI